MIPFLRLRRAALAAACVLATACGNVTKPVSSSEYVLELIWLGTPPSPQVRSAFDIAENTIRSTIVGALTAVALPASFTNLSSCDLPGYPDVSRENIQGLRIYVAIEEIDGPGKTLGSAGPCLIRSDDTPALGVMRFDNADVQNLLSSGRLSRVVLHEMLHVVGFGTVWYDQAVIDTTTPTDARFTGLHARLACQNANGGASECASSVPVHSADGAGSRFSHWREDTFDTELMTPFLGSGATQFSATSIGSLEDLGYEVDYSAAEAYTLPTASPSLMAAPAGPVLQFGEPMQPRWKLDGAGRLTPYRPRR